MATWPRCVLNLVKISTEVLKGTPTYLTSFKSLAVKNIKRFSRLRNRAEIKRYVEKNFVLGDEFALRLLISVLHMISNGIRRFTMSMNLFFYRVRFHKMSTSQMWGERSLGKKGI
jgi:hypothetical protein